MRFRVGTWRTAASVLLAGSLIAGTTACGFVTPQATTFSYDPSDGVSGTTGEVRLLNVLAVTDDGSEIGLSFSAANRSSRTIGLGVQYEGQTATVQLVPEESTLIGEGDLVTFPAADVVPGALVPVYFQYGDEPGTQLLVPVLDGTLPEYDALLD